jgi:S-adenosylmethionine uptake transporter
MSLMLLSWGWARAPAHRLLPIEYTGFIWASIMGYLWFSESLGASTLIGVVLIVAGCWHGTTGGATEGGQTSDPTMHTEQTAL